MTRLSGQGPALVVVPEGKTPFEAYRLLNEPGSIEDVQYQLYVAEILRRRLEQAQQGRFIGQDEAEKRLGKWLIK